MANRFPWQRIDLAAPGVADDTYAALAASSLAAQATLVHDPRWLAALAGEEQKSGRMYTLRDNTGLTGLATFIVHPSRLPLALGELTFFSRAVRRLDALAPPLVWAAADRERETTMLSDLLACVREDMGPTEVVFLESVAEGTAMYDLITPPTGRVAGFHAMLNGNLYRHRLASIPETFDGYLKLLGSKTRADLRTNRKRFLAHVAQNCRTRCFRSAAEVPAFLDDALAISRKTYQYRLLSAGLRDRDVLERWYLRACELGWFRSYILYANDQPIAFQVGYVHGDCFHAHEIGYDPGWGQHHIGIFLHTEIVADLAASGGTIRAFDFGNSDSLHKERLSTGHRVEGYFYLIPDDLKGRLMAHAMRATQKVSSSLGAVLDRYGIRRKTRDFLRRLGVSK